MTTTPTRFLQMLALCLLALLSTTLPRPAAAACSDLLQTPPEPGNYSVADIQKGVSAGLDDASPLLGDDKIGSYTQGALQRLCELVPRAGAVPDATGTLNLTVDYARLTELVPDWRAQVLSPEFVASLAVRGPGANTLALRLAAAPPMTAAALAAPRTLADCYAVGGLELSDRAQAAADTLGAVLGDGALAGLCARLPAANGLPGFAEGLDALGAIEAARSGALADLLDPRFADWLGQGPALRMLGLVGTRDAVLYLIDGYRAQKPAETEPPPPPPARIAACEIPTEDRTLSFMRFGQDQLDQLTGEVDLSGLDALKEKTYPTAAALWDDIARALADKVDDCTLARLRAVVFGSNRLGQRFQLDAEAVARFKLDPALVTLEAAVQPLLDLRTERREELLTGLGTALAAPMRAALQAEVALAADTAAAAAEPVYELFDQPRVDEEQFEPLDPAPQIGVTDATAETVIDAITNAAFKKKLYEELVAEATNPELIKGQVRELLTPLVEPEVEKAVDADLRRVADTIVEVWLLTPELTAAIQSVAQFAAPETDPTAADLAERMKSLVGLEYPTQQLFETALATVPPAPTPPADGAPLSPELANRAMALAFTTVTGLDRSRLTAPLADNCGCVPGRIDPETNHVYGFYPFWLAPETPETDTGETAADGTEGDAAAQEAAPVPEPIDFELFSEVAFYGLELAYEFPGKPAGERNLRLQNLGFWTDARWDFVTTAHRHRSEAHVAIDLRGWYDWTDAEMAYAVERILLAAEPFPRFEGVSVLRAIPSLFDPAAPDAVTLIVEDFGDRGGSDIDTGNLLELVNLLSGAFADRGQTINLNLAVEFSLVKRSVSAHKPLMRDIRELVTEGNDKKTTVDKLLIFLDRPTTESKKWLREQMDVGEFRGEERREMLRSMIPVIPPAAHEFVFQRLRPGEAPSEAERKFGQFRDDVVYFQDNFAGIGFWPVTRVDGAETPVLKAFISSRFDEPILPVRLDRLEPRAKSVCTWVCPNRAYLMLASMALFAAIALLTWRSYYSGLVDRIAFRWGLVWIFTAVLLVLLVLLSVCDSRGTLPQISLGLLTLLLLLILLFDMVQRARNGPKP